MLSASNLSEKLKTFFATENNLYIVIAIAVAIVALIVIVLVSAPKKKKAAPQDALPVVAETESDGKDAVAEETAEPVEPIVVPKEEPKADMTVETKLIEITEKDEAVPEERTEPTAQKTVEEEAKTAAVIPEEKPEKPAEQKILKEAKKAVVVPKAKAVKTAEEQPAERAKKTKVAKAEKAEKPAEEKPVDAVKKTAEKPVDAVKKTAEKPVDAVKKTAEKSVDAVKKTAAAPKTKVSKPTKDESAKDEVNAASEAFAMDFDDSEEEPIVSEDDGKETRPGIIEITKDVRGEFHFRFRSMNGSIVGHSQAYKSKDGCKNGINSVVATCPEAEIVDTTKKDVEYLPTIGKAVFEIYKDNGGKYRFRLTAKNAMNILASQGYTAKVNCFNGAESIKRMAQNHTIDDSTLVRKPRNV